MKGVWTKEELTCPECGWVAQNPNGLRGHRQFKHGVRASGAQLPLQKQDRLVFQSALTQLEQQLEQLGQQLEERLEPIEAAFEQLRGLTGKLQGQTKLLDSYAEQGNGNAKQLNRLTKTADQLVNQVNAITERVERQAGTILTLKGRQDKAEAADTGELCPKCHKPIAEHTYSLGSLSRDVCPE